MTYQLFYIVPIHFKSLFNDHLANFEIFYIIENYKRLLVLSMTKISRINTKVGFTIIFKTLTLQARFAYYSSF